MTCKRGRHILTLGDGAGRDQRGEDRRRQTHYVAGVNASHVILEEARRLIDTLEGSEMRTLQALKGDQQKFALVKLSVVPVQRGSNDPAHRSSFWRPRADSGDLGSSKEEFTESFIRAKAIENLISIVICEQIGSQLRDSTATAVKEFSGNNSHRSPDVGHASEASDDGHFEPVNSVSLNLGHSNCLQDDHPAQATVIRVVRGTKWSCFGTDGSLHRGLPKSSAQRGSPTGVIFPNSSASVGSVDMP
jgi:hypothetical protein